MQWSAVAGQLALAAQSAAPAAKPPPPTPPAHHDAPVPARSIRTELYAGYGGSLVLGGDFLMRYRLLEGGALCQMMFSLSTKNIGCGLALGVSPRTTWLGVDLLGVFGGRHWSGVGTTFLSDDPGGSATLPFAGLRGGVSIYVDPFVFSFWLGVDNDLARRHVSYSYNGGGWFGPSGRQQRHADVGAVTWLAAWRTGLQWDLP